MAEVLVTVTVAGRFMVVQSPPLVSDVVRNALSVPDPQAHFKKARSEWLSKTWDGRIHEYKEVEDGLEAPIGLLDALLDALRKRAVPHEVVGEPVTMDVPYAHVVSGITLDPEQEDVARKLLRHRVCSVELSTGSGKTEIIANAVACFLDAHPGDRALVLVPKRTLMRQTCARIRSRLPGMAGEVGMLGDGKRDLAARILVATPDTACARAGINGRDEILESLSGIRLMVLDEAHRSRSGKWRTAMGRLPADGIMWALSGKLTYFTAKDRHKQFAMEAAFGRPVHTGAVQSRQCPVTVRFYDNLSWAGALSGLPLTPSVTHGTAVKWRKGPGQPWEPGVWRGRDIDGNAPDDMMVRGRFDKSLQGIYDDATGELVKPSRSDVVYLTAHDIGQMEFGPRNQWAEELARGMFMAGEPFLVTVQRRRHATKLYNRLRATMPVGLVHGSMTGTAQERVIARLSSGALAGLVAVYSIISEGVDIPSLVHIIKLDGLSGEQLLEQQKGRVQRVSPGKERGYVHIPADPQHRITKAAATRMATYYRRGVDVERA